MKSRLVLALFALALGVAVYAGAVRATPQSGVTTTFRKEPLGIFGDLHIVQNTFAPGGQTGWHTHPGHAFVTVTQGQITAYDGDDPTCTPHVYTAGQGFIDPVSSGHVHLLWNRTDQPAKTVSVQLITTGQPRRIDVPAPGNCDF
jgi:quercetin dioxygenase-like cupin family protein